MPIKYVGRTTDFRGKTLWEIVGNLKNFGVGRLVKRNTFERYPEPCYNRIIKVETVAPEENQRKVRVWVEKVFRGRRYPNLVELYRTSYKPDYMLVPKCEEDALFARVKETPPRERIILNTVSFPPLLREFIIEEKKTKGEPITEEPKLQLRIKTKRDNVARYVKPGETPTVLCEAGLGKPVAPHLYKI